MSQPYSVAAIVSSGKHIAVNKASPYLFQDWDWDKRLAELGSSSVMIGVLFDLPRNEPEQNERHVWPAGLTRCDLEKMFGFAQ